MTEMWKKGERVKGGKRMAVALLEQVRAAEEKADAIRREAADQARDMLKGVQEATQEENRQYAAELRARYQDKMSEARQAAEEAIRSRSGEKQQALEEMKRSAQQREEKAAALIVERVMQHGNR